MGKRYLKIISVLLLSNILILMQYNAHAQTIYGNEWIIYGNTYYKFGIAKNGIYRITKQQLDDMGMGNVPGSQFAIFREGQEVPIYVSSNSTFGTNDYIELYAEMANGKMDTQLYPSPAAQPSIENPLINDTAYYFLTYNSNPHQRIESAANNIPTSPPTAEPYFMFESRQATPAILLYGYSYNASYDFYSSVFDTAEGYVYAKRNNTTSPTTYTIGGSTTKHKYTGNGSLNAILRIVLTGASFTNSHHTIVKIGSTQVFDTTYGKLSVVKKDIPVPLTLLGATSTNVSFVEQYAYGVSFLSITYPRTFDFSGETSYSTLLQLPNTGSNQYLYFTNFSTASGSPVLIDITNRKRYTGDNFGTGTRYYIDAASGGNRQLFISPASEINTIPSFKTVLFKNYTQTANQGNYIILTHKDYINASTSYVNQYEQYRESSAGGGYNVVTADVTELYDEFGYGYNYHPLGIKHFLQYAYDHWQQQPKFLFIIGKGIFYFSYKTFMANPSGYSYSSALVPTYGHPGSDILFTDFNNDFVPEIPVGRLSAWNNNEIGDYLVKVKAYENALSTPTVPDLENTLWKKTAMHIAGGSDANLQQTLLGTLNYCKSVYEDSLIGGHVITIAKNTTDPIQTETDYRIDSVYNKGLNIITFYGHGSQSNFDYGINEPDQYSPNPKFPLFFGYGCDVAQIYSPANIKSIGEEYLASVNGGSIAMLASDNYGFPNNLTPYTDSLYRSFCRFNYGKTIGEQIQGSLTKLPNDAYTNIHKQCIILQGDPALKIYNPDKPDYYTDDSQLTASPTPITANMDSFTLKAIVYNLGKASHDSVLVTITKEKAGNTTTLLYTDSLRIPILFSDTLSFKIPVNRNTDVGLINVKVKVNADNTYDEISGQNNLGTLQIYISDNGLVPVYPKEFAIVHQQGVELKASTMNLLGPTVNYLMQIDTTALFTNPIQSTGIQSQPGVIKWKPNITLKDSTVYYWRTAIDQLVNGQHLWQTSSFIYLANGSDGWNQSDYYQYLRDTPFYGLSLPANTHKFSFSSIQNQLHVSNRVLYSQNQDFMNVSQYLNGVMLDNSGCNDSNTIQIIVFDGGSGLPWVNPPQGVAGSQPRCLIAPSHNTYQFEFSTRTPEKRQVIRHFIDSIPNGDYILIKNFIWAGPGAGNHWNAQTVTQWQQDADIYGSGNTLYDKFLELGFDEINQFTDMKTYIFFRRKGVASYPVKQIISQDSLDIITLDTTFNSYPDTGRLTSTIIGPAKKWNNLKWRLNSYDGNPENDHFFINIYGINDQLQETLLYAGTAQDTSLSFIPATQYPNIKMVWNIADTVNRTSPHLRYWRVLYDPVPEAALNPLAHYKFHADTLAQGEQGNIEIAIENLTPYPMDSMLVNYSVIDANNQIRSMESKRYKKLSGNDTLIANYSFNPANYPGADNLLIEANPNNDQPEQYHPNNLGYIPFYLSADKTNPLLDVTFDGVHILNKDIVSAKPMIKVMLLDENKFAALTDTSLMALKLSYPADANGNVISQDIPFDGTICKFIPASVNNSGKNQASIEFTPTLTQDGIYKLTVSGKDVAGNEAGTSSSPSYEIEFTVENKPSITNVLNYPNPFSTSTAFLFTLTGSEIPQQFKIQIMTVTGKIVREITKNELGALHIGRNITDYKWDGKDQYGQLLGNGVYIYRVVTSLDGKDVEHRQEDEVDKYFKRGYGKLYIMR